MRRRVRNELIMIGMITAQLRNFKVSLVLRILVLLPLILLQKALIKLTTSRIICLNITLFTMRLVLMIALGAHQQVRLIQVLAMHIHASQESLVGRKIELVGWVKLSVVHRR